MHLFTTRRLIQLAALAAFGATGCERVCEPYATAVGPDADPTFSAICEPSPEIFAPGVISDQRWQWRITFTPGGRTAYFAVSDGFFPFEREATIMVSHRQAHGTWSTPEVAPFSGTYSDIDPFITPDGRRLY